MATQRVLILTGARRGRTCVLGRQFRFVEGKIQIRGDDMQVEKLTRYIGRCYKAFPEGSDELAHFEKLDGTKEEAHGTGQVQATPKPGGPKEVLSDVQPSGGRPPEASPDIGSGADNAQAGPSGSVPSGDGHGHAGDDAATENKNRLLKAIKSLDHTNDEHWTAEGRPRIDAVESAYGKPGVSRAQVEESAPGFIRKT